MMGKATLLLLLAAYLLGVVSTNEASQPPASSSPSANPPTAPDWKACAALTGVSRRLEALPGTGWDNLENKDMGLVMDQSYSQCKTTNDGKYLIPDAVYAIPLQKSQVSRYAEVISHFSDYKSSTAQSMNVHANFDMVSGSFSDDYTFNKENQVFEHTTTTRVQIRHELYRVQYLPTAAISKGFKDRLLRIASLHQSNSSKSALFESDLIIRDFGTHVIRSVVAGGVLLNEDQVSSQYVKDSESSHMGVKASASESFFGSIGFSFSLSTDQSSVQTYNQNRMQSTTRTHGGPPYRPSFNVSDWEDQLLDNLVSIDRNGDPISYLINSNSLAELPEPTLMQLTESLTHSLQKYYQINTHQGCMDLDSPNFDYYANVGDKSCATPPNNYTFGGVYQTCTQSGSTGKDVCSAITQKNPLTGDFSCPTGYEAVLLHNGESDTNWNERVCHTETHHCGTFGWHRCSQQVCGTQFYLARASYSLYWCAALGPVATNSGYLFGGLFTTSVPNPLTQARACPKSFYPLRMGTTLSVCVSDDYELGFGSSLSFAGFFSCAVGNPLTHKPNKASATAKTPTAATFGFGLLTGSDSWKRGCPTAYTQHLAAIDDHCEINYCVKTHVFDRPPPLALKRPPYGASPPKMTDSAVMTDVIISPSGKVWKRNSSSATWSTMVTSFVITNETDVDTEMTELNNASSVTIDSPAGRQGYSSNDVTWIAMGSAVAAIALTIIITSLYRRRRRAERLPLAASGDGRRYDVIENNP